MALETLPHNKTTTIYVEDVEEGSNLKSSNAEVGYKKKKMEKKKKERRKKSEGRMIKPEKINRNRDLR